jgi:Flp pilus assembly protein protease CpaA
MFETISFLIAFIGSSLAAIYDLKITPTEIPDEIPYVMIILALPLACVQSFIESNYTPLAWSLIYGISFLLFGYFMYRMGQWGGGDAKILAAMGFLSPGLSLIAKNILYTFPLSYLVNLFFVGAVYMLVYAVMLSLTNKKIISGFLKSMKSSSNTIMISSPILLILFILGNWYLFNLFGLTMNISSVLLNSIFLLLLSLAMFILWKFVRAVEEFAFKKRIPVSQLKIGDVLLESKVWDGITGRELRKIKRSGKKYIWIKEGVRFAPAFPLALIFTMLFGDAVLFFIRFTV